MGSIFAHRDSAEWLFGGNAFSMSLSTRCLCRKPPRSSDVSKTIYGSEDLPVPNKSENHQAFFSSFLLSLPHTPPFLFFGILFPFSLFYLSHNFVRYYTHSIIMQRIETVFTQAIARQILTHVVVRWVQDFDISFFKQHPRGEIESTIEQLFGIIAKVFEMYGFPPYYLAISVFYGEKFVRRYGVKHNQIFNLLITRYATEPSHIPTIMLSSF